MARQVTELPWAVDGLLKPNVVVLVSLGYRVEVAESGEATITSLRDHPVDLVILDLAMPPGIDGAETSRQARALRPGQRAIPMSGFAESGRAQEAQALGDCASIQKPVTRETLAQVVRAALDHAP